MRVPHETILAALTRLELIKWEDSEASSGWQHFTVLTNLDYSSLVVFSLGFVLKEDEQVVQLVQSIDVQNDNVSESIRIPKCCILERRYVQTVNSKRTKSTNPKRTKRGDRTSAKRKLKPRGSGLLETHDPKAL